MTKRFTAQHTASGYAAMGGSLARPRISAGKSLTVQDLIAKNKRIAAREAAAKSKKK